MHGSARILLLLQHSLSTIPGCLIIFGIILFVLYFLTPIVPLKPFKALRSEDQIMISEYIASVGLLMITIGLFWISFTVSGCLVGILPAIILLGTSLAYYSPHHSMNKFIKYLLKFENKHQLIDNTIFAYFADDDRNIRILLAVLCPFGALLGFFVVPGNLGNWVFSVCFTLFLLSLPIVRGTRKIYSSTIHYRPNPPLDSDPACIAFRSLSTFRFLGFAPRLGAGGAG